MLLGILVVFKFVNPGLRSWAKTRVYGFNFGCQSVGMCSIKILIIYFFELTVELLPKFKGLAFW